MIVEQNVPLQAHNSFGIVAKARELVRVRSEADVQQLLADPALRREPQVRAGRRQQHRADRRRQAAGAEGRGDGPAGGGGRPARHASSRPAPARTGTSWSRWTLDQGFAGLENLALIPGTVGASPVQNIGAYGVELQDRFESLDAIDLLTGRVFTLDAAQCAFGYRDSVFKHAPPKERGRRRALGLAGRALILRVRLRLPKPWKPVLGYLDLERKMAETRRRAARRRARSTTGSARSAAPSCRTRA